MKNIRTSIFSFSSKHFLSPLHSISYISSLNEKEKKNEENTVLASYVDLPRQRRSANPRRIQKVKPSKRGTLVSLHVARDSPLFAKVATPTTTNTLVNRCATWPEQHFLSKCRSLPLPIIVQAMLSPSTPDTRLWHATPQTLFSNAFVLLLHNFLSIRFSPQISSSSNFCPRKFFLRGFLRISAQRLDSFKVHVTAIRCYISLSSFNLNLCPFDFAHIHKKFSQKKKISCVKCYIFWIENKLNGYKFYSILWFCSTEIQSTNSSVRKKLNKLKPNPRKVEKNILEA